MCSREEEGAMQLFTGLCWFMSILTEDYHERMSAVISGTVRHTLCAISLNSHTHRRTGSGLYLPIKCKLNEAEKYTKIQIKSILLKP